jgi:hemerythrin superfamily protein
MQTWPNGNTNLLDQTRLPRRRAGTSSFDRRRREEASMAERGKSTAKKQSKRPRRTGARTKDAIALLKADHREVEKLFKKYQSLGERAIKTKGSTIQKVCTELQIHDVIERAHLYPMSERLDQKLTKHALEEHDEVNELIDEIKNTEPDDERMEALMEKLISDVKEHVEEEEKELFPQLQDAFAKEDLREIGKRMAESKKQAKSQRRRAA